MGLFSGISRAFKKILKSPIGKIALPIAGYAVAGPAGAALASGGGTVARGGSLKDALMSAGTSYLGGQIGGSIIPGTVGSTLGRVGLSSVGNALGSQVANASIGTALGSFAAGNAFSQPTSSPDAARVAKKLEAPTPFSPSRQAQIDTPGSLSGIASLTPEQQASNIATQGVYGSGGGPEEQAYFTNLINRRLVDESGNVDENTGDVSPIEKSYLAQLGLGGYSNNKDLLEAISKWKAT